MTAYYAWAFVDRSDELGKVIQKSGNINIVLPLLCIMIPVSCMIWCVMPCLSTLELCKLCCIENEQDRNDLNIYTSACLGSGDKNSDTPRNISYCVTIVAFIWLSVRYLNGDYVGDDDSFYMWVLFAALPLFFPCFAACIAMCNNSIQLEDSSAAADKAVPVAATAATDNNV